MAGGGGKGAIIRKALEFLRRARRRAARSGSGPTGSGRPPFRARPSQRDRHGRLTDGTYTVSGQANLRHTHGQAPPGRSHFNPGEDVDGLTLEAAQRADHGGLWTLDGGHKAKVPFDRDVGIHSGTGAPTNVVNVYRRDNGTIHGAPGSRL